MTAMKAAFILATCLLITSSQGRKLRAVTSACTSGDASCWCAAKGATGTFADTSSGCKSYYECVSATQTFYRSCPPGLMFAQTGGYCDWPANVVCSSTPSISPSPTTTPSPTPTPTLTPAPTPTTTPTPTSTPIPTPTPSPASSDPCPSGDAACFCNWKGTDGMFANIKAGCSSYYWCTSTGDYHRQCQSGLLFSESSGVCNWASAVTCAPGASPTPTPTPSPTPSPSPSSPPPPSPPSPPPSPPSPPLPSVSNYRYVGYFQSWSAPWSSNASSSALANLPPYMNVVILSFMNPDTTYTGGMTWAGTGMQFSSDPTVVKDSIAILKKRNPGTTVLIAVGGATYTNFKDLNAPAIARFVQDFGLDGVDLDYEPTNANCVNNGGSISCATDAEYIASVKALRAALPRPLILSNAPWSVGAYGEGAWASAQPASPYTGVAIQMLKAVGNQLDLLNLMSYDAGPTYDPKQALNAYRHYFPSGEIVLGVEVANEAWGGHVITLSEVQSIADYVKTAGGNGMMLWSIQKPADQGPTATQISQAVCSKLGLAKCTCGLFCPPSAR